MDRLIMGELIDEWSTAGFEEGKYYSPWGKGVFHQKYASESLQENTEYIIKNFDLGSAPLVEALDDLNEILSKEGYKAEFTYRYDVHQDIRIHKI